MTSRPTLPTLILAVACAGASLAQGLPPAARFTTVDAEQAARELRPDAAGPAATRLAVAAACSESIRRAAFVSLSWTPVATGATGQRVDISKFRDGFETGRYETSQPLSASTAAIGVEAPEPGINYYWRVVTALPGGSSASAVERFEVPICPWDPIERDEAAAPGGEA